MKERIKVLSSVKVYELSLSINDEMTIITAMVRNGKVVNKEEIINFFGKDIYKKIKHFINELEAQ